MMKRTDKVLGIMSGTSLDGVDLALCSFKEEDERWFFEIHKAQTLPYDEDWKERLREAPSLNAQGLSALDMEYGHFLGRISRAFLDESNENAELIASHGHTIFHNPKAGYTFQTGSGAALSVSAGLPVVCNFRSQDVAKGGQGAPLVPVGDRLLFGQYDMCLNIGGIANISFENKNKRIAFDICPANMVLNYLAALAGKEFDRDGLLARSGQIDLQLLNKLNELEYYQHPYPKSLGREWVESAVLPVLKAAEADVTSLLATAVEHIAQQISFALPADKTTLLLTGGGALNTFLSERIASVSGKTIVIPSEEIVHFKEALIFAFLGHLRRLNKINVFCSVTGASSDSCSGAIYLP